MIYSIDKFETTFEVFTVTFVRVATGLGWYATIFGETERYGDYVTLEKTADEQMVMETFDVLAQQAADSLTTVHLWAGIDRSDLSNYLREFIKRQAL